MGAERALRTTAFDHWSPSFADSQPETPAIVWATTTPAPPAPTNPGPPPVTQSRQPNPNHDRSNPLHPATTQPGDGPIRSALLSSTVCNTSEAHKLAAQVEHAGGWPVVMAAAEAKQAGLDWHPAATAVGQRLTEDANRHRARPVPHLAREPDPTYTTGLPDAT
jgi:hypothetical protein